MIHRWLLAIWCDFVTRAAGEAGQPEAVIEHVLPRKTLLTRPDSFRAMESHPIVANAQQMLIVASIAQPRVKWGLIDRMIVAARAGRLATDPLSEQARPAQRRAEGI